MALKSIKRQRAPRAGSIKELWRAGFAFSRRVPSLQAPQNGFHSEVLTLSPSVIASCSRAAPAALTQPLTPGHLQHTLCCHPRDPAGIIVFPFSGNSFPNPSGTLQSSAGWEGDSSSPALGRRSLE